MGYGLDAGHTLPDIAERAEREFLLHLVHAELRRLHRVHAKICRARRKNLEKRIALVLLLDFEHAADRLLALHDAARIGDRDTGNVHRSLKLVEHLAHMERMSSQGRIATERRGGSLLALERSRRHLSAGHAIEGVVDEDAAKLLTTACRLECIVEADGTKVAVALIGNGDGIGTCPARAGGSGGCAPVCGGYVRSIPVVVGEHSATYGIHKNRIVLKPHLGAGFSYQLVDDSMPASGAIVGRSRMRLAATRKFGIHSLLFYCAHIFRS